METEIETDYITVIDFARSIGKSPHLIYFYIREGKIAGKKIDGHHWIIPLDECFRIEEYIDDHMSVVDVVRRYRSNPCTVSKAIAAGELITVPKDRSIFSLSIHMDDAQDWHEKRLRDQIERSYSKPLKDPLSYIF